MRLWCSPRWKLEHGTSSLCPSPDGAGFELTARSMEHAARWQPIPTALVRSTRTCLVPINTPTPMAHIKQ